MLLKLWRAPRVEVEVMSKLVLMNVFLGGVCVVAASVNARAHGSGSPARPAESPDASFVHKAGAGDLAEVQLSRLAVDQAASPKVREFASRMVQDHERNSTYLATIAARENLALPDAIDDEHTQLRDALAGERGASFDNAYMTAMLKDHQQMATLLKSSEAAVRSDELRTFIKQTLPVVEHHLRMAQDVTPE